MRFLRLRSILVLLLLVAATAAFAQSSKLDSRARVALASVRSGLNAAQVMSTTSAIVTANGDLDVIIQGNVSRAELEAAGAVVRSSLPGGYFTANLPANAVDAVTALPGVMRVSGARQCEAFLNTSVPTTLATAQRGAAPTFTGANGAGVLVGDIDTGVSWKHGDFKDALGNTRVLRIWDQLDLVGPNPSGYAYGSEWLPADINAATARETDTNGHGTHCMSIAGGNGQATGGAIPAYTYVGMAPMADLVAIKSDLTDTHILDGLAYFWGLATALSENAVMNMSFGSQYGPHDGTDAFEGAISASTGPGRVVVVAAGNDGGSTSPLHHIHASCVSAYPGNSTIVLNATAGSSNGRIIGLDGYYEATEAMNVSITGPGTFGTFGPITLGNINAAYPGVTFGTGTTKGYVYIENGASLTATNAREVYIEVRAGTTGSAFTGAWTITFTPTAPPGASNGRVDLWQFYTSSTSIAANFTTGLEDNRDIGEPANGAGVIAAGAWVTKTSWTNCANLGISYSATTPPTTVGGIAEFSSAGPTRDGRMKPDIAAPGQGIGAALTRDVTLGTCTTSSTYYSYLNDNMMHWINQGTSMSAPHVVGAVALLMQKFGALSPAQVMTKLSAVALVDGSTGAVPNNTWGAGKLRVDVTNPVVTVSYPNGGEGFLYGSNAALTWTATDNVGVTTVNIDVSRDGGATFTNIATGVPNTGSYNWTVLPPASTNCLLKVTASDASANLGSDLSDNPWSIIDPITPIAIADIEATPGDGYVQLSWTSSLPPAAVYMIERSSTPGGTYSEVKGSVAAGSNGMSFRDAGTEFSTVYYYKLGYQTGGAWTYTSPIRVQTGAAVFGLRSPAPNPTASTTRLDYEIATAGHVSLNVYDLNGRHVRTLVDGTAKAGVSSVIFDGRNQAGSQLAAGVYFARLTSGNKVQQQRLVLVR